MGATLSQVAPTTMPVTPDLLYLAEPHVEDAHVLYPWEQSSLLRESLDAHVHGCPVCTLRTTPIFSATMTRTSIVTSCVEGTGIGRRMQEVAEVRRAGGKSASV